ncbi:MAG: oxidoreductase [Bacteroidetes bacterium]|nr:oxidoreductase [Bacteroidota bacterium]
MTILILGASGLVGGKCLQHSLSDPRIDKVTAVVRRELDIRHPKLTQLVVDFDKLDDYASDIRADAVLSALGTTRKQAGSAANFRKVDYDYQLRAAEIARRNGTRTFVLLSSGAANKKSLTLYLKVKGEIEDAISKLGFEKMAILRPSVLLGERKDSRSAEAVAQWAVKSLLFVFSGPLAKYKGIEADTVALAMVNAVQKPYKGVRIVENLEIFEWAKS